MRFFIPEEGCIVCFFHTYSRAIMSLIFISLFSCVAIASDLEIPADDCAGCHVYQLQMIVADGGKHATEVSCLDCHPRHPPEAENTITACVSCHEGQPHFQIGSCRHCHINPHMPMAHLRDPLKPVREECLSCHAGVGQEMAAAPSRHAEFFCNRCHNQHKEIPGCLDCHETHLQKQSAEDCLHCHSAHRPLRVVVTGYVPAAFCAVCHEEEARELAVTNTNHGGVNCNYCHKGLHPSTPSCQECHGLPHPQAIHSQHRTCLDCHEDAHRMVSGR